MRVVWAPIVLDRVEEAARYIAQDRPRAAAKWIDGLFNSVRQLADFPESGRVVPEVGRPEVRELIYGQYRVIYRLEAKRISMLTVRHQRQRWTGFESSEE